MNRDDDDSTYRDASPESETRAPGTGLATSRDIFRLLVETVRDYAIFVLDSTGHVMTWNAGAQRIKGYSESDIVGRHFSTFYPPEDLAWDKPAWELREATRVGRFEDEGWRLRKDGTRFWANVIITALRDETGTLVGFAKVTRDLTERRQAEQRALEDARRVAEAEAANRTKSEFLTAMSHELRTPLNAIGGYAELIALGVHGPVTEEQAMALERIRRSQQHLLGIINDLLNYSRIEAGHVAYDIERTPVDAALREVAAMVEPQATIKRITVTVATPVEPLEVMADRAKLEQILINLLSNAVKFTPERGSITLDARPDAGGIAMEVRDTGIGIPADKLEAIFEPFVQVGRNLTSNAEGTGLGLAISRDLARAMRGELSARSTEGRGSTFTLVLPRAG